MQPGYCQPQRSQRRCPRHPWRITPWRITPWRITPWRITPWRITCHLVLCGLALLGAMVSPGSLWACDLPVFRYALEYWPADRYEMIVLHPKELSPPQEGWLERNDRPPANFLLRQVDPMAMREMERMDLLDGGSADKFPQLVVRYPRHLRVREPLWTGPFTAETVESVLHSPVRSEIVRRLLAGDSAVWLLVESGDAASDERFLRRLETELTRLESELVLPTPMDLYPGMPADPTRADLRLDFSVLRMGRDDAGETVLLRTLLQGIEAEAEGRPVVFPIFGRGRALAALFPEDMDEGNVEAIATFLVGRCSCQVKALNPGWDLLLSADWERGLVRSTTGYVQPSSPSTTDAEEQEAEEQEAGALGRNIWIALSLQVVVVVLAGLGVLWWSRRRRRNRTRDR